MSGLGRIWADGKWVELQWIELQPIHINMGKRWIG